MHNVSQIVCICLSSCLLILIFELVRRRKLKEKYAFIWLITGITILIFAVFDKLLIVGATLVGIKTPINVMFLLGIFFIISINLNFSIIVSNLMEQNKKIVQKLALLEAQTAAKKRYDEKSL